MTLCGLHENFLLTHSKIFSSDTKTHRMQHPPRRAMSRGRHYPRVSTQTLPIPMVRTHRLIQAVALRTRH